MEGSQWPRWAVPLDDRLNRILVKDPGEWANLPPGYGSPEQVDEWRRQGVEAVAATPIVPADAPATAEPASRIGEVDRLKAENQVLRETVDELTERVAKLTQTIESMQAPPQAPPQGAADGNGKGAGSSGAPKGRRPRGRRTARAK